MTTWLPNLTVTTSVITRQPCRKDNFLTIIVSFVLASRPGTEFSGDISAIFAQIWNSTIEFSSFLRRIAWIKWVFGTQNFFVTDPNPVWGTWHLMVETAKRNTFAVYSFHLYHCFALKLFPYVNAQDTENSAFFCSSSAHVRNFWKFSRHHIRPQNYDPQAKIRPFDCKRHKSQFILNIICRPTKLVISLQVKK